jgi:hypothetical protein
MVDRSSLNKLSNHMKKPVLIFTLSVAIFCFLGSSLSAEDKSPSTGTTSAETISKELPTAIKLGIADGIVRYINNDRRIKIQLVWEPLPITDSLIDQSIKYNFVVTKLKISNQDIESGRWVNQIAGLPATSVDPLANDTIRVSEYMQMQRERNILTALLLSKGGEYSFGLEADKRSISPPNFSDKKIDWYIDVYTFKNSQGGEYYRFTAKAVIEPFDVSITEYASQKEIFYDARFKLKESQYISQIANNLFVTRASTNIPGIEPVQVPSNFPKSADLNKSLSSLSGFLSIVGGSEQLGAVTEGLLGGTEDTSIVSGGLIGNGGVSALLGVNREVFNIGDDTRGGILLGLGLGDKTSLFLGPSLQSSIFTISAGARIGTQNTDVNFAGMVAVDLSRLTNSKKNKSTIPLSISNTGGGLGQASEQIINTYTLLEYEQLSQVFVLTRVCDEKGDRIPELNKNLRNVVNLQSKQPRKRIYLPRGVYRYTSITGKKAYQQLLEDKLGKFQPQSNQDQDGSDSCDP